MKKLMLLIPLFILLSCGTVKVQPIETKTVYNYVDSLRIKDSTIVIPVERIRDVVPVYDTLNMETSMALSKSWVDTTTHTLKGTLKNRTDIKYKYIYKDRIVFRDSIITKEIPVEVEVPVKYVPPFYKKLLAANIAVLILAIGFLIWKFRKKV